MKHKVSELKGALLDRAVGMAAGEFGPGIRRPVPKAYTSDWSAGGPIIERERIRLPDVQGTVEEDDLQWCAHCRSYEQVGPTPLIAAMRAFVVSELGEEVEL